MNSIRSIQALNKRELEAGVSTSASWHSDYRDTAWIYIGGLPFEVSEGDVVTIFSQFGEPVHINLVRDKETGKSKGFAFLKYEDQRSTDLAVDNLGGATIMGRILKVDHTRYKRKDDEDPGDNTLGNGADDFAEEFGGAKTKSSESEEERPMLREERELALLTQNHDNDDPMKEYLIRQKTKEVESVLKREKRKSDRDRGGNRGPKRPHRSREDRGGYEEDRRSKRRLPRRHHSRDRSQDRSPDPDLKLPEDRHREGSGDRKSRRQLWTAN